MEWYEEDIKILENKIAGLTYEPGLVFYGSSSIRLWNNLQNDFEDYAPLNLGFGGSTLEACALVFTRIFKSLQPKAIILYAGDNDLGDGKKPEDVLHFYRRLRSQITERFSNIPVGFISIKPSFERWAIADKIRMTNKLILTEIKSFPSNTTFINIFDKMLDEKGYPRREFFDSDGLHINDEGYVLWKEVILHCVQTGSLKLPANIINESAH